MGACRADGSKYRGNLWWHRTLIPEPRTCADCILPILTTNNEYTTPAPALCDLSGYGRARLCQPWWSSCPGEHRCRASSCNRLQQAFKAMPPLCITSSRVSERTAYDPASSGDPQDTQLERAASSTLEHREAPVGTMCSTDGLFRVFRANFRLASDYACPLHMAPPGLVTVEGPCSALHCLK